MARTPKLDSTRQYWTQNQGVLDIGLRHGPRFHAMRLTGKRCQCGDGGQNGGCGEHFASVSAFDRHRVGNRGVLADPWHLFERQDEWCLSEFAMEAIGMFWAPMGEDRVWYGSRMPIPESLVPPISDFQVEAMHG